jgi:hypothetical protein
VLLLLLLLLLPLPLLLPVVLQLLLVVKLLVLVPPAASFCWGPWSLLLLLLVLRLPLAEVAGVAAASGCHQWLHLQAAAKRRTVWGFCKRRCVHMWCCYAAHATRPKHTDP